MSVAALGSSVEIRNADQLKHNAFSKQPNRFDLGKQLSNASGIAQLPDAGVTKIQCRFHPKMMAQVLVLKNNCFASVKNGVATIQGVPSGENKIKLWSPHLKQELEVTTKTTTAVFSVAETDLARITPVIGCPVDAPSEY